MSIHYLISFDLTHGKFHVDTEDEAESFVFTPEEASRLTGESQLVRGYPTEHGSAAWSKVEDGEPGYPNDFKETVQAILDGLGHHFKTTDTQIVRLP